jgi:hypothetical protein
VSRAPEAQRVSHNARPDDVGSVQSRWGPFAGTYRMRSPFGVCGAGLCQHHTPRMGGRAHGVRRLTHDGAMTNSRARCAFCYAESADFPVLTREHLVSRPVGSAFGIDRTSPFLRTDRTFDDMRWTTVNGISRKVVCTACNNGG